MRYLMTFESFKGDQPTGFNINKVDIKAEYDYLNKLLFDGKLPNNFDIRLEPSKETMGWVDFNDDETLKELVISSFYDYDLQQFRNILAHEMCHVKNFMDNGLEDDEHSENFYKELNRINTEFHEFKIQLTYQDIPLDVNPELIKNMGDHLLYIISTDHNKCGLVVSIDGDPGKIHKRMTKELNDLMEFSYPDGKLETYMTRHKDILKLNPYNPGGDHMDLTEMSDMDFDLIINADETVKFIP